MKEKLIIAHRGNTSSAIENTLEAFRSAIYNGADMIEFDVWRALDGCLIVHHDKYIQKKLIENICWKDIELINRHRNFRVPRLEEALKIAKGKIKLNIEIKERGYETEIMKIILQYLDYKDFIITSFDELCVKRIKEKYPKAKTGLLFSLRKSKRKLSELLSNRKYNSNTADFFLPHSFLVRLGFLGRTKKYKKRSIVWGVNSRRMMKKMLEDNRVEGIITDKLDMALKIRKELISEQ